MDFDLFSYLALGWVGIAAVSLGIRIAIERWFWKGKR